MPLNNSRLLFIITVVLALALAVTAILAEPETYRNLLLITSKPGREHSVRLDDLEELNEKCVLTYEIKQESVVQTEHKAHTAVLKGTNYTYPFITRANLLSGGFFTKEAEERESRAAVLNELASFEMFGGVDVVGNEIRIRNNVYTITGVINDGDEDNQNIYIPGVHLDKTPVAFLSLLDDQAGATYAYIENEFKQIGITSANYDFMNLDSTGRIIREKAIAAFGLLACVILILVLQQTAARLRRLFRQSREKPVPVITFLSILAACVLGLLLRVLTWCVEIFIGWSGHEPLRNISIVSFQDKIQLLQSIESYTSVLFIGFTVMLALFFITSLRQRGQSGQ